MRSERNIRLYGWLCACFPHSACQFESGYSSYVRWMLLELHIIFTSLCIGQSPVGCLGSPEDSEKLGRPVLCLDRQFMTVASVTEAFAEFPPFFLRGKWTGTSDPEVDSRRLTTTRNCTLTGRQLQDFTPYFSCMPGLR